MFWGRSVAIVGDSHAAGPPGQAFARLVTQAGGRAVRVGVVGRGPADYVAQAQPALAQLFATRPDVVVYWFGTNDGPGPQLTQALEWLRDHGQAAGAQVWYVGPPSYPTDASRTAIGAGVAETARAVFGKRYIDGRKATETLERRPDNIHFTPDAGAAWARSVLHTMDSRTQRTMQIVSAVIGVVCAMAFVPLVVARWRAP